jgi:O-antigen/teichoic acid export membrane protein
VEFDWRFWRFLARSAFPFGLNLALGLIHTRLGITMLSLLRHNEAEIGFYRAALALVMYWPVVGASLTTALFPMMSELYLSRRESFIRNYRRSVQWLFALGLPMTIGLCLLGDRFITSIYGRSFAPAVVSLRILSASVLLKFIHGFLAMVLTSSNRQALRTGILASAALGNTLLNLLLIPWAGQVGASVAAVLTDSWILAGCYLAVSRQLGGLPFRSVLGPSTLSAIVMGLGVLLLRRTSLPLLITAAVVIYGAVLCALGGVPQEELAKCKALLPLSWRRRV